MGKINCFITIGSMQFGGIPKSLLSFLNFLEGKAEVDLLIWNNIIDLPIPEWVNVLDIPTVKSVKKVVKEEGILSKNLLVSLYGSVNKKRWQVMHSPKKEYDVAIAYDHVGLGKYYIIDKVEANKKFTFFHNGAYTFGDDIRSLDIEYYRKYDAVFAVSEHIKDMLHNELAKDIEIKVLHNLVDIKTINEQGKESCEEMDSFDGLKFVTVGRLSEEKNQHIIPKVCAVLKRRKVNFRWYIIGEGYFRENIESEIQKNDVSDCCILCGSQINPYKYMSRCDVYTQFSVYEAEPITIQEVAAFGKPMVLSNIDGFKRYAKAFNNITLTDIDYEKIADKIIDSVGHEKEETEVIINLQKSDRKIIDDIILKG